MSTPIAVPDVFAKRIAGYLRQQQDLSAATSSAVATAAELLNVPQGWQYDPDLRLFVPPPVLPPAEVPPVEA